MFTVYDTMIIRYIRNCLHRLRETTDAELEVEYKRLNTFMQVISLSNIYQVYGDSFINNKHDVIMTKYADGDADHSIGFYVIAKSDADLISRDTIEVIPYKNYILKGGNAAARYYLRDNIKINLTWVIRSYDNMKKLNDAISNEI